MEALGFDAEQSSRVQDRKNTDGYAFILAKYLEN
jgi:hypothetical protein